MVQYTAKQKAAYYKKLSTTGIPMVRGKPSGRVKGRGDYRHDIATTAGKGYGAYTGAALGTAVGGPIGGVAGMALGQYYGGKLASAGANKLFGKGDYSTNASYNVLSNTRQLPLFDTSGYSNCIKHREYVGEIISSPTPGAFNLQSFELSPTNVNLYPWLSSIAENYQQYKCHGMIFEFRSTSGDISTTTALGTVMMATDYNVNSLPPASKIEMMNKEFSNSCKPSRSTYHAIECAPFTQPLSELYTNNNSSLTATSDKRLSNFGTFHIATQGFPGASTTAGELYVSFLYEFSAPSLPQTVGGLISSQHMKRTNTISTSISLGLIQLATIGNFRGFTASATGFSFNAFVGNKYYVKIWWSNCNLVTTAPSVAITGATNNTYFGSGTVIPVTTTFAQNEINHDSVVTATSETISYVVGPGIQSGAGTAYIVDILITELDSSITQ